MKRKDKILFLIIFAVVLGLFWISAVHNGGQTVPQVQVTGQSTPGFISNIKGDLSIGSGKNVKPDFDFGNLPLYFIENKGQVNRQAKFYAKTSCYTLWMTEEGLFFDSISKKDKTFGSSMGKNQRFVSRMLFTNAKRNPEIVPVEPAKARVNYFIGNDQSRWHGNVPTSLAVMYKELYKSIDLKVFGKEKRIEYDWHIKPGGNPSDIKIAFKNVKSSIIDNQGNLVIETEFGNIIHKKPVSYQVLQVTQQIPHDKGSIHQNRAGVDVRFRKIGDNSYGFIVGKYDKTRELVIDPVVLLYSSYLGGSSADCGRGIAFDGTYVYITGYTDSTNFPTKNYYVTYQGSTDCFVTKIDALQSGAESLIYSTYLGGGGTDESRAIAVDSNENVYITGYTMSTDFPVSTDPGAYQPVNPSNADAFITRLDTAQSGAGGLIYSSYLGGDTWDEAYGIACDDYGNAYVTGYSQGAGYPTTNNKYQDYVASHEAFISHIDTCLSGAASLVYSTYLGGDGYDGALAIAVDSSGYIYVTGYTNSTNFPISTSPAAYQSSLGGEYDVFISKLDPSQSGSACLLYSSYLGGSGVDEGWSITVEDDGDAYITGKTTSTNFPISGMPFQSSLAGGEDAFITKIKTVESGTVGLKYSTYFGGSDNDRGYGIVVDIIGCVHITGQTYSSDYQLYEQYQDNQTGVDAFVTRLKIHDTGSSDLIYSTYLGGSGDDSGQAIAVNTNGSNAYITGWTESTDFPTFNQFMADPSDSYTDAFVTKLQSSKFLVVNVPNGSELWSTGNPKDITWTSFGLEYNLKITLWRYDVLIGTIKSEVAFTQDFFTWPAVGRLEDGSVIQELGDGYQVKIKEIGTGIEDMSDNTFCINGLAITSPQCGASYPTGENWNLGSVKNIEWATDQVTNNLKITLWKDGVLLGRNIADNIPPEASPFAWTVGQYTDTDNTIKTALPGTGYQIKIKEKLTLAQDMTCNFNITQNTSITTTTPNGGEQWTHG